MSAPDIDANRVAKRKLEEERITFMRQCAIAFSGSASDELHFTDLPDGSRESVAAELVKDWSALFGAIEATRGKP